MSEMSGGTGTRRRRRSSSRPRPGVVALKDAKLSGRAICFDSDSDLASVTRPQIPIVDAIPMVRPAGGAVGNMASGTSPPEASVTRARWVTKGKVEQDPHAVEGLAPIPTQPPSPSLEAASAASLGLSPSFASVTVSPSVAPPAGSPSVAPPAVSPAQPALSVAPAAAESRREGVFFPVQECVVPTFDLGRDGEAFRREEQAGSDSEAQQGGLATFGPIQAMSEGPIDPRRRGSAPPVSRRSRARSRAQGSPPGGCRSVSSGEVRLMVPERPPPARRMVITRQRRGLSRCFACADVGFETQMGKDDASRCLEVKKAGVYQGKIRLQESLSRFTVVGTDTRGERDDRDGELAGLYFWTRPRRGFKLAMLPNAGPSFPISQRWNLSRAARGARLNNLDQVVRCRFAFMDGEPVDNVGVASKKAFAIRVGEREIFRVWKEEVDRFMVEFSEPISAFVAFTLGVAALSANL